MIRKIAAGISMALAVMVIPVAVSAHVVVKPAEVGIGAYQSFATGVPNEKDIATTGVRVVIPGGLKYVQPNVKPGWTIEEKKTGDGLDAIVTEISWTGGSVPAGQRDDFLFSAQAPAKPTTLNWKAYQTYEDGTVVAWDQKPDGKDSEDSTPYSQTKVIDDLTTAKSVDSDKASTVSLVGPYVLASLALVVGFGALLAKRK